EGPEIDARDPRARETRSRARRSCRCRAGCAIAHLCLQRIDTELRELSRAPSQLGAGQAIAQAGLLDAWPAVDGADDQPIRCRSPATNAPVPYAAAPTSAPRPSISSPFVHHRPLPIRDRAAPTANRTAKLRMADDANRFVAVPGTTYGTSGTVPAATNAMNVAMPCLIGDASSSGSCCASRTRSSDRIPR